MRPEAAGVWLPALPTAGVLATYPDGAIATYPDGAAAAYADPGG